MDDLIMRWAIKSNWWIGETCY